MTTPAPPPAVRVHVVGMDEGLSRKPRRRPLRNAVVLTVNLTAAQPYYQFLPYDTNRLYVLVQAGGSNVVLCTDLSQAQDKANQVTGVPNPNGYLLTAGNTTPIKIEGCQPMWVVGNTFPSQLTWIAVHEQPQLGGP